MKYYSTEGGMTITISVRCQDCDEYLNTLGRDCVQAKSLAKSMNWGFDGKRGWLCAECWSKFIANNH